MTEPYTAKALIELSEVWVLDDPILSMYVTNQEGAERGGNAQSVKDSGKELRQMWNQRKVMG